jgi:hypothetical protein
MQGGGCTEQQAGQPHAAERPVGEDEGGDRETAGAAAGCGIWLSSHGPVEIAEVFGGVPAAAAAGEGYAVTCWLQTGRWISRTSRTSQIWQCATDKIGWTRPSGGNQPIHANH